MIYPHVDIPNELATIKDRCTDVLLLWIVIPSEANETKVDLDYQGYIINPTKISFCDHSNLLINGNPWEDMLTEDKYHLSSYGLSFFASNLKKAIHSTLGLPLHVHNQKNRSRSRGLRAGRGRGGRMYNNSTFTWPIL